MDKRALRPSEPTGRHKASSAMGSATSRKSLASASLADDGLRRHACLRVPGDLAGSRQADFPRGPATYGFLTAAMGVGAVLGGLVTAGRGRTGLRHLTLAGAVFGVAIGFASLAPVLALEFVAMAAVGWASVTFLATGNSTLQLQSEPSMRGRVMSLWAVAFQGSTPIGGPLIGWIVAAFSAGSGSAWAGSPVSWRQASGFSRCPSSACCIPVAARTMSLLTKASLCQRRLWASSPTATEIFPGIRRRTVVAGGSG